MIKVLFYLVAVIPLTLVIASGPKLLWGANRLNSRGLAEARQGMEQFGALVAPNSPFTDVQSKAPGATPVAV